MLYPCRIIHKSKTFLRRIVKPEQMKNKLVSALVRLGPQSDSYLTTYLKYCVKLTSSAANFKTAVNGVLSGTLSL